MKRPTTVFRGTSLYLYAFGTALLLLAPFLTWTDYGPNALLPYVASHKASLIDMFEGVFWVPLAFYLLGVSAALAVTAVAKRPPAFVSILPALFPLFWLFIALTPLFNGSQGYSPVLTPGVFGSLIGSALLELSSLEDRRRLGKLEF